MTEKILENFVNPVKSKILLVIAAQKQVTARELRERLPDIPQATLYRHLKKMTADGVIRVAEERKVRAVTERVYALADNLDMGISEKLEENRADVLLMLFRQFAAQLVREFAEYAARDDVDFMRDLPSFTTGPISATTEEVVELLTDLGKLLEEFRERTKEPHPGRRLRSVALIITPPRSL